MNKPRIVFSDFDGTMTVNEQMVPLFFDILSLLNSHNIPLVIVTGRSQAWGHFFLTHFDMSVVVTEGGGVISRKQDGLLSDQFMVSDQELQKLELMTKKLLDHFPGLELSVDSQGRKADRAIELSLLKKRGLKSQVENFLSQNDVHHSCSNVHLNFWCGDIEKAKTMDFLLAHDFKHIKSESEIIYFGDSLNDQSVFKRYPHTVGVSNIAKVLDQLTHRPSEILVGKDKEGPYGVYHVLEKYFSIS